MIQYFQFTLILNNKKLCCFVFLKSTELLILKGDCNNLHTYKEINLTGLNVVYLGHSTEITFASHWTLDISQNFMC